MVAYNFNKPILLTDVGGLSEYVNHRINGYLVEPSVQAITLSLEDYYIHNREEVFSSFIKNKKSNYTWSNMADQFDNLYKNSKYV